MQYAILPQLTSVHPNGAITMVAENWQEQEVIKRTFPNRKDISQIFIPASPEGVNIIKNIDIRSKRSLPYIAELPEEILQFEKVPSFPPGYPVETSLCPDYPLFPFQVNAFKCMVTYRHWALFMDTGTGKTRVTIEKMLWILKNKPTAKFLIIAPPKVAPTWEAQLNKYAEGKFKVFVVTDKHGVEMRHNIIRLAAMVPTSVLITNYETFVVRKPKQGEEEVCFYQYLFDDPMINVVKTQNDGFIWDMAILDESTKIKSTTSSRTKGAHRIAKVCKERHLLSGFPSPQDQSDYVGQLMFLHPGYLGYHSQSEYKSDNSSVDSWTKKVVWRGTEKLKAQLSNIATRIDIRDCDLGIPEEIYKTIYHSMTPEQTKVYNDLSAMYLAYVEQMKADMVNIVVCPDCAGTGTTTSDETSEEDLICELCEGSGSWSEETRGRAYNIIIKNILNKWTFLQRIVGGCAREEEGRIIPFKENPRLESLVEFVETLKEENEQFVIFSKFRWEIDEIAHKLNIPKIYGGTNSRELNPDLEGSILNKFRKGDYIGLVIHPEAGGMGVDGLQVASTVIYYSNDFKYEPRKQSIARLKRIGQKKTVKVIDFCCPGTVDEVVIDRLQQKKSVGEDILKFPQMVFGKKAMLDAALNAAEGLLRKV